MTSAIDKKEEEKREESSQEEPKRHPEEAWGGGGEGVRSERMKKPGGWEPLKNTQEPPRGCFPRFVFFFARPDGSRWRLEGDPTLKHFFSP